MPTEQTTAYNQVIFDGRLLKTDGAKKKVLGLDEHPSIPAGKAIVKTTMATPAKPANDVLPMTPPHVSGVSLAPMPEVAHTEALNQGAAAGAAAAAALAGNKDAQKKGKPAAGYRPSQTFFKGSVVAVAGGPENGTHDVPHLVAEGKGLARSLAPNERELNPHRQMYREINDSDSLCATPLPLGLDVTDLCLDCNLAMGPLTPHPLSPSILTLCGTQKEGEKDPTFWSSFGSLPDMRDCNSPIVPGN